MPFVFALALALLALTELRMVGMRVMSPGMQTVAPMFRSVSAIVPLAMAAMVFGSGLLMLFSSLIPPTSDFAEEMEFLLPLGFVEGGALLSSTIGASGGPLPRIKFRST